MILKSLHIENYGKFSNYDYSFSTGINGFCEQNGFGKTTIASFIKAMFYGLPSYRTNTKEFNDRAHFYPFNGKKFGGNISFIMEDKEYRIERFFDKKSDSADTLNVFCNNSPYYGFGNEIGKSVFGLDKESFERTVFIDSSVVDFGATGSIGAKLNNYVDGINGENTFDDAVNHLEQAKKQLKFVRGNGGKITETKREISELNDRISNLKTISTALERKYTELNNIQEKIHIAEEKSAEIQKKNVILEQWKTYDSDVEQITQRNNKLQQLTEKYPSGLPKKSETDELKRLSRELEKIKSAGSVTTWDGEKKLRLNSLKNTFGQGVPSDENLEIVDGKIEKIAAAENEIRQLINDRDSFITDNKFNNGMPSETQLAECEKKITRLREIDDSINVRVAAVSVAPKKEKPFLFVAGIITSLILIICGVILCSFVNLIVGAVVVGIGALLLAASIIIYFLKYNGNKISTENRLDEKLISLQTEKKMLTEALYAVIAPFGYYSGNGVQYDFLAMKADIQKYTESKEKQQRNSVTIEKKKDELKLLNEEVVAFFNSFGMNDENFSRNSRLLHAGKTEYLRLIAEEKSTVEKRRAAEEEFDKAMRLFTDILAKYNIDIDGNYIALSDRLDMDRAECERLAKEIFEWQAKADDFKARNGLNIRPITQDVDLSVINDELNSYRNRVAILENEISADEAEIENLDVLYNRLEERNDLLNLYQNKYNILENTIKMLKTAEQNLKDRYISPVKDCFLYYADMIEETLGERVVMDGNFNLAFDHGGEIRSDKHLSLGQRSICALCFRLALIDNMYEEEKPFVIMDDPFVNIDGEHLPKTLELVKLISGEKQIIYFCCHKSRQIVL